MARWYQRTIPRINRQLPARVETGARPALEQDAYRVKPRTSPLELDADFPPPANP
jgi:hypothetical protein